MWKDSSVVRSAHKYIENKRVSKSIRSEPGVMRSPEAPTSPSHQQGSGGGEARQRCGSLLRL
jgi:hypothetical protein